MPAGDFYERLRDQVRGYTGPYAQYVLLAPDLVALVSRLMLDPRVDGRHKVALGAALAYTLSPIDLVSERSLGAVGYLDDIAVVVAALNMVLNDVDEAIVLEHWSGDAALLRQVREFAARSDQLIGRGRLEKILQAIGLRAPWAAAGGST
jgi:uncharacterized membrane protein YkvA (DUF1232 family)